MKENYEKEAIAHSIRRSVNGGSPSIRKKRGRKRKFSKFLIVLTAILQLMVSALICLGLLVYGPFGNMRKVLIGTAMSTYSHQYIAKMLFSQKQIDAVLNSGETEDVGSQDLSGMKNANYTNKNVTLTEISSQNGSFHGYLLEVPNPLRVKIAVTDQLSKVGELTSRMAEKQDAVAAINGGGFYDGSSYNGTGAYPTDFVIIDGKVAWQDPNYSKISKSDLPLTIGLDSTGTLIVGQHSITDLLQKKVQYAVTMSGYQPLVLNGKGVYKNDGGKGYQPRTVIGQKADKTILMLVLDGRKISMKGASLLDAQKIMLDHGAVTAANLDGGNSTTMYYDGEVINHPSGDYGERTVATCFYVEK